MIIQTGMRTDIPAFYSEWLMNRLKEGYVLVRNPYHPSQVTRYSLSPDVVDLIAFCTKNPGPMLSKLNALNPYGQYWFVTITPYGREIEPNVPDKKTVLEYFRLLSEKVGKECVAWRYDPVFVDETYTAERHIEEFEKMASCLSGYTESCVVSFLDIYKKVRINFPTGKAVPQSIRIRLGKEFIRIADHYGMVLRPCAEGDELAPFGADCSGCMTIPLYEKALHEHLEVPRQSVNQRNGKCACLLGADIGAYDTCAHFCRYCYANTDRNQVILNRKKHDPGSPFLTGQALPDDVIHEAKQKSWIDRQLRLNL